MSGPPTNPSTKTATKLFLPSAFPYPIKVVSLDSAADATVQQGTRLFTYSFVHTPAQANAKLETRFGTWDSPVVGSVSAWKVRAGEVITKEKAQERPVVLVMEDCKHEVQAFGLCASCGADMTGTEQQNGIEMTHSANGPVVSLEEAQRHEREIMDDLLKARKLVLVVDLDQTIVHATVDPTVGEWRAEGAAWKARQAEKPDPSDECNPNWEALEDVGEFRLKPESMGKNRMYEHESPVYYLKRRPGWQHFLETMATKYQMHVYTMGTRAYAEQVCALIDPDNKIFGSRLLSRDESGSVTQKTLARLFPCDQSMVVIIDDRADVWQWSPNLVKVVPYDFFVGIGDINSSFLPKIEPLTPPTSSAPLPDPDPPEPSTPEEVARKEQADKDLLAKNTMALEAQVEERPLAKKQEQLKVSHESHEQNGSKEEPASLPAPQLKEALLKNDDHELERLSELLDQVHGRFFASYEASPKSPSKIGGRQEYDTTRIIPRMRREVFDGLVILFSSVIPLDTNPETAEIWKLAVMFGAECTTTLEPGVTHVVAAKRGTVKVDSARKRGNIKIVWLQWFLDCINLWHRQDETPYLLDDPPPVATDPLRVSSSSGDVGEEEWDSALHNGSQVASELSLDAIDWNDIDDEIDAAMDESDDDHGFGDQMSEDDWTEDGSSVATNSNPPTPSRRKRMRSLTPSDIRNGHAGETGSPLAKRKKIAAERTGASKLKEAVSAEEIGPVAPQAAVVPPVASPVSRIDEGDSEEEYEEEEEDDFLARELEDELG
ncbi:unnamed protein product [Mycena citricolor]|uniref:RNA polymerase II subunit A C-terminal domain phosphatase n=1 Tax=Mycena citricolor TaxID=2018698 RepID=A0AAD2HQS9_9AGAR|nr:unnamed protein product [Mycena citricolor]